MAGDEQVITWEVHSHEHRERSNDWYWGLGIAAGAGILISIFLGNVLLAFIIGLGAVSAFLLAVRGPREHSVRLDARGISIDGTLYRHASLRSFWVDQEREEMPDHKKHPHLYIVTGGLVAPHFTLPLESAAHAEDVRNFLRRYVKEEEQGPHFSEHLAELLGL